jgi:hypothetical protein
VQSTDIDEDTNETMWRVLYDDGDKEGFSVREMAGSLVNEESEDEDGGAGEMSSSESGDSDMDSSTSEGDNSDGEPGNIYPMGPLDKNE